MNSLYNPVFLLNVLKSYLFDIDRLHRLDDVQLRRYQDKKFHQIVNYAYSTSVYHDLYSSANVKLHDIKGINYISRLPLISKEDIGKYHPDGIIPSGMSRNKLIEVSTSGTTGKSLSIFVDMYDVVMGLFGYLRMIREYGINWRKQRLTIIGDFAAHTAESGYVKRGLSSTTGFDYLFKNIQWLDTNSDPKSVIEDINRFKPDFIGGYVGMLGHLALLREKGFGSDIKPVCIAATGSVLQSSLKKLIADVFETTVFEAYGATESGPIAFECPSGCYHILSDLVFLEFLKDGVPVASGKPGNLVITKLFGNGTPIIRYNAINDIVSSLEGSCDCGMSGGLIDKIYGRDDLALYLSDGRVLLAASINEVFSRVLYVFKSTMIKDVKVIQRNMNNIDIGIVVDEKQRGGSPSVDEVFNFLKACFKNKVGESVNIRIHEIKSVDRSEPRIISQVDASKFVIKQYD